ncbi:hypothetical protein EK904_001938 [Melospiza melodia maxima]|nr:hypothetical protein EK904_001938 [Melospiza melodia maxima]
MHGGDAQGMPLLAAKVLKSTSVQGQKLWLSVLSEGVSNCRSVEEERKSPGASRRKEEQWHEECPFNQQGKEEPPVLSLNHQISFLC